MYLCGMNVREFEKKVADYAKDRRLPIVGERVIVTLSGGADSVALFRVLLSIGAECVALHCNFGLRGAESDRDEAFVRNLCAVHGVSLKVRHFDVAEYEREHKVSTEMACRELRYAWFEEERKAEGAKSIAVAHHHDDNVETFFLNLFRGSGVQGLAGIKPRNGNIVRPLLCVTREEIEGYLAAMEQDFVVDSTNLENDYKRNKIRNVLIPAVKELFPNVETGISRTLQNLQGCNELYQCLVDDLRRKSVKCSENGDAEIDLQPIGGIECGGETALFEMLKEFGFNSVQCAEIYCQWQDGNYQGQSYFSPEYEAVPRRTSIELFKIGKDAIAEQSVNLNDLVNAPENSFPIVVALKTKEKGVTRLQCVDGKSVIALSREILENNVILTLRKWRSGDKIHPYGMNGSKTVANLLADAGCTEAQKRSVMVLAQNDDILWVLGVRASNSYRVKKEDETYLELHLKEE